jgi:hypothetical protein
MQSNLRSSGVTSSKFIDTVSGFLFMPLCGCLLAILCLPIIYLLRKYFKDYIDTKLKELKKKMIWNSFLAPWNLSFYSNCITLSVFIQLKGPNSNELGHGFSLLMAASIFVYPIVCLSILLKYTARELLFLHNKKFQSSLYPEMRYSNQIV